MRSLVTIQVRICSLLEASYTDNLVAVEAIEKAVDEVAKYDADDWFVIAISDANFGRYQITAEDLKRALGRNTKVRTALICIGEGAEATW